MSMIDERLAARVIVKRPQESHKGDYGRVLLIGGLPPYEGAIIMAATACVNAGVGLVSVATHPDNLTALHSRLPEAMAFDVFDQELLDSILKTADLVLIGPGLSETANAEQIFHAVLQRIAPHQILVLDGSALNLSAKFKSPLSHQGALILTPHQREWERLSGLPPKEQTTNANWKALAKFPLGTLLVAKRHHTQIYEVESHRQDAINNGGPYQATGGMGDTLAGMIAAFSVQFPHVSLYERVSAAVYVHSAIADELAVDHYVTLPSQIAQEIPHVMKRFEQKL